jgi:hypothetical protein
VKIPIKTTYKRISKYMETTLASGYTQHMNRGWYTSDLHVIINDFGHEIGSVMGSWSITSQTQCCNMTSEWLIIRGMGLS